MTHESLKNSTNKDSLKLQNLLKYFNSKNNLSAKKT